MQYLRTELVTMIKFLSSTLLMAAQLTATAPSAVSQPYTLTGSIEVWEGLRVLTSVLSGQYLSGDGWTGT